MSLNPILIAMVRLSGEVRTLVLEVARLHFPSAQIADANSVEEAVQVSNGQPALLVLGDPHPSETALALAAADVSGLPACGLVVFTAHPVSEDIDAILPEEADEYLVVYALQSAVRRAHQRRELARARGDLLAIARRVCHDLRAPLGGVVTTMDVLKEALTEDSPALVPLTDSIFEATDGLTKLIERVSFLTRASADPRPKTKVDMGEAFRVARQRLEWPMSQRRVSVAEPDSWPCVQGVSSWLETVWWNLLNNALQHGGATTRIEVGHEDTGSGLRFWVRDQGPGVPPEKRARLFEPFHLLYRLNSRRGLGLSIVQRLVEMQGGHCAYESPTEGGACFSFVLPAAPVVAPAEPHAGAEAPAHADTNGHFTVNRHHSLAAGS